MASRAQRTQCHCPFNALQWISVCLNQETLPFDSILQIGSELTGHFKTVLDCQRCATTKRMANMLSQITSRLVCFYEAAYLNAATNLASKNTATSSTTALSTDASTARVQGAVESGFLSPPPPPPPPPSRHGQMSLPSPHHSTPGTNAERVPACQSVFCDMKLGKLPIDGPEARMLVEVVLVDACLDLNDRIQEWKHAMDESTGVMEEEQHQQCDAAACRSLDRLAKLIGLLQFDGLGLDGS